MPAQLDTALPDADSAYRAIFEASSDGLVINDAATGVVLEANPAFCRMHGYDDMTGLHPTTFIHPSSYYLFEDYVRTIRDGGEFRGRAQDVRRDGTVFHVEVLGRGFLYQGRFALLGVVRDVTEQVRTQQGLEERVAARTREIERRREVAEALRDLLATINSTRTLDEILAEVLAQAARLLGCQASAVYVPGARRDDNRLHVTASMGLDPEYVAAGAIAGVPVTGLAFSARRPVAVYDVTVALDHAGDDTGDIDDVDVEDRRSHLRATRVQCEFGELPDAAIGPFAGHRGILAVPLAARNMAYGCLTLLYREPREFSDEDVWLATAFADQAALAIENARLHAQAEQRLHEQAALHRADQQLHRSLRLELVLQALVDAAADILMAESTAVLIWDQTRDCLVLGASRGLTPNQMASMTFAAGEGVIGRVALTGQPRIVEDALADADVMPRFGGSGGVRAGMHVPIILGERVFGVFAVAYTSPREFSTDEQRLLLSLAQRAALAIDNARSHGEAERRLREVEALYRADEALHRSLQLDQVLEALCTLAVDILGADKTAVWTWDEQRQGVVVAAAHGVSREFRAQAFVRDEPALRELDSADVTIMEDVRAASHLNPEFRAAVDREGVRSWISAAIRTGEEVFGSFAVGFHRPRTFDEQERRLVLALAQRAALAINNARLFQRAERRLKEIEALYRADEALHRSLRLDEVLETLAREATEVLRAAKTLVMIWDAAHERLVVGAAHGFSAAVRDYAAAPAESPINATALGADILSIEDARTDPRLSAAQRALAEREGVVASVNGAIRIGDEVFGAFSVNFAEPHTASPDEERLLMALTRRAALAIQNARLHQESEQRRHEMEALYTADETLHRSLRLDDVLQALVEAAAGLLHADAAGLWGVNAERGDIAPLASRGLSAAYLEESLRLNAEPDVLDYWWAQGTFAVEDVSNDPRLPPAQRAALEREGCQALLSTQIRIGEEAFGSFTVGHRVPHRFDEHEQRLLTALAQRAGLAIQNARLYEQAQQAATLEERQRLARELHDAVTQTLFSTALIAEVLPELWDLAPDEGRQQLGELRRLTRGALAEMRTLLVELRPGTLTDLALGDLVRQLAEATAGRTRLEVSARVQGPARPLPAAVQVALYRLAQEAINNVVKHAQARQATLELVYQTDGSVHLQVADDGRGFDPSAIPAGHLGVGIMRERADAIGACFQLASQPGGGTRIDVTWREAEGDGGPTA